MSDPSPSSGATSASASKNPTTSPVAPGQDATDSGGQSHELKRVMGPGLLLLFIVGDILGTGVYALTGNIAGEIGGAAWAPILVAFVVATITAFSYLELVTKYPGASGAALYTHKAFGLHFLTFLVTFAVLCSGLTSAATASSTVASNFAKGFHLDVSPLGITVVAVAFMALLALINLRGVSESVKLNVVLTVIELTGLLIVILVGFWAAAQGNADFSRTVVFETSDDKGMFLALTAVTSLAFFSFVGFEDSVNMVEETKDPTKNFPRVMLIGLCLTGVIYVVVSVFTVAIVPIGELGQSTTPLLDVVKIGAPGLPIDTIYPFLTIFAVANTALINMLMASRLLYGMAKQGVIPGFLGKVLPGRRTPWTAILFTTALGMVLVILVNNAMGKGTASALGGTTALLLLAVFTVVNVAAIILRRDRSQEGHKYFHAPRLLPYLGAVTCAFLLGPWAQDTIEYQIALVLIALGVVLWLLNFLYARLFTGRRTRFQHPEDIAHLEDIDQ
ncbi:amino acid transporter [Kocuria varians]|uniref:Amino acid transporter n=1 Tax=Kocuria varians TaxID=1272 RepID=A0A4Y4D9B7_KOCVA|nr:APC family permease [Kocuria varians]GED00214.1 amino acid transporter [Kocuria varians]